MKSLRNSFPEPDRTFHERIVTTLNSLPEKKESIIMKKVVLKRCIITAVCAAVILGTAALARGPIVSRIGHSWGVDYNVFPTQERVEKDTGIKNINIPEKFSAGYEFENGKIVDRSNVDENGNKLDVFKSTAYKYTNGSDRISIHTSPAEYEELPESSYLAGEYNGVQLYYINYKAKFVPPDYKMTDEDKTDEESGKYVFSYGSDKVEIEDVQQVIFETDGKYTDILSIDGSIDKDGLLKMSEEIIDNK